jgi:hypothetical protein
MFAKIENLFKIKLKLLVEWQFLVLPHKRRGVLDSMVRWYPRKTHFATWNRYSRKIGISMKMLAIELNSVS